MNVLILRRPLVASALIASLINVALPAFAQPPTPSVNVVNPATQPVLVRDVDAQPDTREPVQFRGIPTFFTGGSGSLQLVTVPQGKRLIIEHVSILVNENSSGGLTSCALGTTNFGGAVDYMPCIPMGSNALNHFYAANHDTKYIAEAGETVSISTGTIAINGEGFIVGFASGYYVPAPAAP